MAFLVSGRWLIAAGIALVAASIHPLQALPALLLIWADRIRVDRRWLWLITAAIPALLLAQAGVEPLSRLLDRYDSEWMSWIREPSRHVFLTQWPWPAWGQLLTDFFLLGVVARHAPNERVRRFAVLLFFVGLAMFSLAATLADALWLVLPTGLQLWRVQWLIHWTAFALLPAVLLCILRQPAPQGGARRATLLLGVALLGMPAGRFSAAMAAPLAMLLFIGWPMVAQRTSARWQALAFWVVPLGVLIAYCRFALSLAPDPHSAHAERFLLLLLHPLPLAALALGAWRLLTVSGGPTRLRGALAVLLSCFLVVLAVNQWDQRSTLSRIVESTGNSGNPFAVELEADKQVYWYQDLLLPWLSLRRASFWNGLQGAGLLFNRGTAAAYHERETLTGLIEFQGQICTMLNALERDRDRCTPDIELFTRLCNQSQLLGYVVLPFNLPRPALGTWHIPRSFDTDHEITYRLYACEAFR